MKTGCVYRKYGKRVLDIVCALAAMVVFCWLYAIVALLVRVKMGSPVIFKQLRPGKINPITGQERIFTLYKFRTMTDAWNKDGMPLPDDVRLTRFGKLLRSTSLDELPEVWNIIKGDMSVVGPRPQLVRDMVFMTQEQRQRHTARPGLSGLAQVRGRNTISWEGKFAADLEYIQNITFIRDIKIIILTLKKALLREGINAAGMETAEDLGDYLLRVGAMDEEKYKMGQEKSDQILLIG